MFFSIFSINPEYTNSYILIAVAFILLFFTLVVDVINNFFSFFLDHDTRDRNEGLTNHGYQYDELDYQLMYGQFDGPVTANCNDTMDDITLQVPETAASAAAIAANAGYRDKQQCCNNDTGELTLSSCLPDLHFSLSETEYDEGLKLPDSITILSTVGDKPVLVERNTDDDDFEEDDVELRRLSVIPFTRLYGPSIKFNSFQRKVFMPGIEIQVRFIDTERSVTTHLLNPNL